MDYKRAYQALIDSRPKRVKARGLEEHHIVPESIGGSDDDTNLVMLTPREHLLAHLLLARAHPEIKELITAAWMMSHTRDGVRIKSTRTYETLRSDFTRHQSERNLGKGNPRFNAEVLPEARAKISAANLGHRDTDETKAKKSLARMGKKPGNAGMKASAETRAKISAKVAGELNPRYGITLSEELRQRISESTKGRVSPRLGVTVLEETKKKLSEKALKRERIACIHCGTICTKSNLTRWHNDNCKKAPK